MSELATKHGVTQRYIAHLIQLAWLSPDIIQAIYRGQIPATLSLERLKKGFPPDWGTNSGWNSASVPALKPLSEPADSRFETMALYGLLSGINQFAYSDDFTVEQCRKLLKVGGILRDSHRLSLQTRLYGGVRSHQRFSLPFPDKRENTGK